MKVSAQEIINTMILAKMGAYHLAETRYVYSECGSSTAVLENITNIREIIPEISERFVHLLSTKNEYVKWAEQEYNWCIKNNIQMLCYNDEDYPQRLKECKDAPLLLFYKGQNYLNAKRTLCIIGTRRCTMYGKDIIKNFINELKTYCPQTLIISGLAYGVDINAHRMALDNNFLSVGVLAHGLDTIYPSSHKETAIKMINQGGLITEYSTRTKADKLNFVRRNRIVAGMSDACILIESATKGGGLITAGIATDYGRDVFAFPGSIYAPYSCGCNELIAKNGASLLTSAKQFVQAMGWEDDILLSKAKEKGIDRELFPELAPEEKTIIAALQKHNDLQINMIVAQTHLTIATVTTILFNLEMKGIVKGMAGGSYHLLL